MSRGIGVAVEKDRVILDYGGVSGSLFPPEQALRLAEALEWCAAQALPERKPVEQLPHTTWRLGVLLDGGKVVLRFFPPRFLYESDLKSASIRAVSARAVAKALRIKAAERMGEKV